MKSKLGAALLALALSAALGVTGCEEKEVPVRPEDRLTEITEFSTPDPGVRPETEPAARPVGGGANLGNAERKMGKIVPPALPEPEPPAGPPVFTPVQPPAPGARVIEVVDQISPSAWRVSAAVTWLDGYTTSKTRMVSKCSGTAYRCVTFRQGTVSGDSVGWSSGYTITIDVTKANSSRYRPYYSQDSYRTWLLTHEFGHQFALPHRSDRNLMNPVVTKGALVLNSGQKTHLRAR